MSLIPQLPITGAWKERFEDVTKLNVYAKDQPVELSNVKIQNKNIDGAVLNGGEFNNNDWSKVSAKKSNFTNLPFRQGILEDVDFSDSTLTNVVFEDVKLLGVKFFYTTLNNVRFVRCTFNGVGIEKTKMSRIEVIDSKAISSSFSDGQLVAVFRNSKLARGSSETSQGVRLTDLIPPSSLTFEKSELIDANMERSRLAELVIDNSKFDSIYDVGSADRITVRNSTLDTSFSAMTIGTLSIENSTIKALSILRSKVNTIQLSNCQDMNNFGMYETTTGAVIFTQCQLNDFRPRDATIELLRVTGGSVKNSKFERMKVKIMILNNVTLDGELNFTDAHVDKLETHNITKQPGLNLITTGSNVHLE